MLSCWPKKVNTNAFMTTCKIENFSNSVCFSSIVSLIDLSLYAISGVTFRHLRNKWLRSLTLYKNENRPDLQCLSSFYAAYTYKLRFALIACTEIESTCNFCQISTKYNF